MKRAWLPAVFSIAFAAAGAAQQRPIFDPDDFIDPRQAGGPVFISRLVMGVARDYVDDYRPLHQNTGYLLLTNNLHVRQMQFGYEHSEMRGDTSDPVHVRACGCSETIYFPTPPPDGATPAPPLPSGQDTVRFAWYVPWGRGAGKPAAMLRYRLSWTHQKIGTVIEEQNGASSRLSGREQSFALDADTWFRVTSHDIYGSLLLARTARTGTVDDRSQTEIVYTSRFPVLVLPKRILLRTTLAVGGVTNRGAAGLNVVNPLFEAFWHEPRTQANFHLIYSPQKLRDGDGWHTHHQIAAFVDRALFVKLFTRDSASPTPPPPAPSATR